MTEHKTRFEFHSDALDDGKCQVFAIEGEEGLSMPYRFAVDLVITERPLNELAVLQQPASLAITSDDKTRTIHGVLAEFQHMGPIARGVLHCRAVLVPRFWMLGLSRQTQIFGSAGPLSVVDVLKHELLGDGHQGIGNKAALGLLPTDFEFRLSSEYPAREHIVQYRESDLNFVSRLMEHEGIWYFFEQGEEREKIIFCDANVHSPAFEDQTSLRFHLPFGHRGAGQHAMLRLSRTLRRLPAEVLLSDYNYELPHVRLQAGAPLEGNGARHGVVTRYGDHFKTPEEGARYARLRAEELACEEARFDAESDSPLVGAGYHFDLENHYSEAFNQRYLITSVTHRGRQPVPEVAANGGVSEVDRPDYRNTLGLHASSQPYRPPQVTPRPNVPGIMNAHVDAEGSGERAEIDSQGRYKVVMPFDQRGADAGKASRYMRMSQPYAGRNTGMHFPLLKGTEVLWACVDGNPDRPVICGSVPNPNTKSPVTEADQMKNRIVTTSGITVEMNDGLPQGGGEDDHWPDQPAHVATEQQQGQGTIAADLRTSGIRRAARERLPEQCQAEAAAEDDPANTAADLAETWFKVSVPNYDGKGSDSYFRLGASDRDEPMEQAAFADTGLSDDERDTGRFGALLYCDGDYRQRVEGDSEVTTIGESYEKTIRPDGTLLKSERTYEASNDWRTDEINNGTSKREFNVCDSEKWECSYAFEGTFGLKEEVFIGGATEITAAYKTAMEVGGKAEYFYGTKYERSNDDDLTFAENWKTAATDEILLTVHEDYKSSTSTAATLAAALAAAGLVTDGALEASSLASSGKSSDYSLGVGIGTTAASAAALLAMQLADQAEMALDKSDAPQIKIGKHSIELKVGNSLITIAESGVTIEAPIIATSSTDETEIANGDTSVNIRPGLVKLKNSTLSVEDAGIEARGDIETLSGISADGHIRGQNIQAN